MCETVKELAEALPVPLNSDSLSF